MQLCDALGVRRGEVVAFIGAGGKTSALIRLGRELADQKWRVLATTTTRIAERELQAFPDAIPLEDITTPQVLSEHLTAHGFVFIYERIARNKVIGVAPEVITQLADSVDSDVTLVEADGSRRLPLKAPYTHEPVIPKATTLVVPVVGMDVLGRPLNEKSVYNVDAIIEHFGFPKNAPIIPAWIAQIVRDEALGLQGIPQKTRIVPLLNKTGRHIIDRVKARRMAQLILREARIDSVAIGRVKRKNNPVFEVQRRIGAIVLAGGMSRRMGQPKQLLPWGPQTVIETIAQRLLPLPLADTVIVTGHLNEEISALVEPLGVRTVHNEHYATGEMLSTLQTGLNALDKSIAACLVFLGDQPQINARVVHQMLVAYAEGKGTIVAPSYRRRRGHPILIDRQYWREILRLPEGSAPRDVINAYADRTAYILTEDASVLNDMDTPEDYREALRRAGLL